MNTQHGMSSLDLTWNKQWSVTNVPETLLLCCLSSLARLHHHYTSVMQGSAYVAVSGRNRTIFRCIFWSHHRVRSAVTQYFHYGRAHMCYVNTWILDVFYTACKSPTLNGSSVLQCFKRDNAIEIRNEIMFDFYPGLPHVCMFLGQLVQYPLCIVAIVTTCAQSEYPD